MASITRWIAVAALLIAACASDPSASECATGITCPSGTKCAAVQPVCITNDCGDGIVQATEECDDGNITDGDGCAANCLSREECGDGVINAAAGELCDDRNTVGGDGCAADCRSVEVCGNGIRDLNEVCDDGNTVPGDGCSGNCKSTEVCGNNIVDINEKCDDGGAPGGCNSDCQGGTGCGDGAIDKDGQGNPLEECDDGNNLDNDDCIACHLSRCGDGIKQTTGHHIEQCDPSLNFGETAGCNIDCTNAGCGDFKINKAAGEQCDAGPAMNADNRDCTAMCKVNVCGDTKSNTLGPNHIEQCDDGKNGVQTDGCSDQCTTPTCGNGVREMTEACDDGNTTNGDGCSSTCKFESCGDGVINNGEACDPGMLFETPGCNSDCTSIDCGDGKVNHAAGEQCDDANMVNDDACKNDCSLNVCGDGVKGPSEACDDGDQDNTDGCTTSCTTPFCSNGIVDMGEQCDDGNTSNLDGCLNSCNYNTCGDGFKSPTEQCDNGANNGFTKDCLPTCKTNVCGDGYRDQEGSGAANTEACDDGNIMTETSCPYGLASCTMCDSACDTVLNLTGNVCGDGNVDATNEMCDDKNQVQETSCPYGTPTCTGFCSSNCQAPLSLSGPYCGDGTTDTANGEACDDKNALACGRCDASCNVFASSAAGGWIHAVSAAQIQDDDTLTINDGFTTYVIEFDKNTSGPSDTGMTNRVIDLNTETAAQVRTKIRQEINNLNNTQGFKITATDGSGSVLVLTHTRKTSLGNQVITETVNDADFIVMGMAGGAGGNCPMATKCTHNDDCTSGTCTSGVCQ